MEVACRLEHIRDWPCPRVVVAGFFDGVHRGHQKLLRTAVERARCIEGTSAVLTFDPHPLAVIRPDRTPLMLGTMEEKLAHMSALGVEHVLKLPFDEELQALSPEKFVEEVIVKFLSPRLMIVGFNFTFGSNAAGRVDRLEQLLARHGIETEVLSPVEDNGTVISSTVIRDCLIRGDVERAAALLGRPYYLHGQVGSGHGRGRTLGFPTCNLEIPEKVVVPKQGVYAVSAQIAGGRTVRGVCNIGCRPTFGGAETSIEVHLIGHKGNYYGEALAVGFHRYLRDEERFSCAEMLRQQIGRDIENTRQYFSDFARTSRV